MASVGHLTLNSTQIRHDLVAACSATAMREATQHSLLTDLVNHLLCSTRSRRWEFPYILRLYSALGSSQGLMRLSPTFQSAACYLRFLPSC